MSIHQLNVTPNAANNKVQNWKLLYCLFFSRLLIGFVESNEPLWKGYLYAVGLLACATVQTMLLAHYFTRMYLVGMRIRTALTSAIYRKSLRMSNAARKESTVGEIVNLMSVDAQRYELIFSPKIVSQGDIFQCKKAEKTNLAKYLL